MSGLTEAEDTALDFCERRFPASSRHEVDCNVAIICAALRRRLGATNAEAVDGLAPVVGVEASAEVLPREGLIDDLERALAKLGRLTTPHPYASEARHFIESARRRLEPPPTGTRGVSEALDFDSWWSASKYRQVIFAGPTHRQIAKDAWDAALSAATSGGEHG